MRTIKAVGVGEMPAEVFRAFRACQCVAPEYWQVGQYGEAEKPVDDWLKEQGAVHGDEVIIL